MVPMMFVNGLIEWFTCGLVKMVVHAWFFNGSCFEPCSITSVWVAFCCRRCVVAITHVVLKAGTPQ